MNVNEQLAVLTALKKAVDERLKEVRSGADEAMRDAYEEDGVEKKALKVCGEKVGELVVDGARVQARRRGSHPARPSRRRGRPPAGRFRPWRVTR